MSQDKITTLLDVAGLVLVAAGLGALAAGLLLGAVVLAVGVGAAVAGAVLLVGSRLAVWNSVPSRAPRWWARLTRREAERR